MLLLFTWWFPIYFTNIYLHTKVSCANPFLRILQVWHGLFEDTNVSFKITMYQDALFLSHIRAGKIFLFIFSLQQTIQQIKSNILSQHTSKIRTKSSNNHSGCRPQNNDIADNKPVPIIRFIPMHWPVMHWKLNHTIFPSSYYGILNTIEYMKCKITGSLYMFM